MIDKTTVEHILEAAVQAPSGDNAQPWRFRIEDQSILIFNVPGADGTLYNYLERGSYISHGAVIENLCILGEVQGMRVNVTLFPGPENCVARLELQPGAISKNILSANIVKRSTNRKPYLPKALDSDDKYALQTSVSSFEDTKINFAEGENVKILGNMLGLNERLLFENRELHDFLFSMIRWSRDEERQSSGLYIKTLELPLPIEFLFKYVFADFSAVEALNYIGLSRLISMQTSQIYSASSAFIIFTISNTDNAAYVKAGRAIQRLWLTAEEHSLNIQPVAAIPYLASRIRAGAGEMFTQSHKDEILNTEMQIRRIFGLKESDTIAMLFRVGYGSSASARSLKSHPKMLE